MELLNNKEKVYVLEYAKELCETEQFRGMCTCLDHAISEKTTQVGFRISNFIPNFTYSTARNKFGARDSMFGFWWNISDREHRLAYFDYLIDLYKEK